ncbi:hypothetical protein D3C85_1862000 [compost metagenome]
MAASSKCNGRVLADSIQLGAGWKASLSQLAIKEEVSLSDDPLTRPLIMASFRKYIADIID